MSLFVHSMQCLHLSYCIDEKNVSDNISFASPSWCYFSKIISMCLNTVINGMWGIQGDKVTGTCSESDRMCV